MKEREKEKKIITVIWRTEKCQITNKERKSKKNEKEGKKI